MAKNGSLEKRLMKKMKEAVSELTSFSTNENVNKKIKTAIEKTVVQPLRAGSVKRAKSNAKLILKKIKVIKKKYSSGQETLETVMKKIRELEDDGNDVSAAMQSYLDAETALKNIDYQTYDERLKETKSALEEIAGEKLEAVTVGTEEEKEKEGTGEAEEGEEKEEKEEYTYDPFANIQDIRGFIYCKLCGEKLGEQPITQCEGCGKRYHTACAKDVDKCRICGAPLGGALPEFEGITDEPPEAETVDEELTAFMSWYDKWFRAIVSS